MELLNLNIAKYPSADVWFLLPYLYGLHLADGRSEGCAFVCVVGGTVQSGLSNAKSLGGDANPPTV